MKKKYAILGMLAGITAGSALADTNVQFTGTVDNFVGSMRASGDQRTTVLNSGGMTTSWFGFKGSEDLGGGLRADFALTSFFQADSGTQGRFSGDTLFSRDANIALNGAFGRAQLGRGLAPSFLPYILSNPFGDSFTFSPLVLQSYVPTGAFGKRTWPSASASDSGWSNEIIYTTPEFAGFKANVHYQFGEVAGDNGKRNVGVNALYFNGPITLTAFYHNNQVGNPTSSSALLDATTGYSSVVRQKAWFVGGAYNFQVVKLFASYQNSKDNSAASTDLNDKTWSVGASVPLGAGAVLFDYAQTRRSGSIVGADIKRDTASLGYDYNLSKRTDMYAIYMTDKVTAYDRAGSLGVGVRHRF
jgi:predicted porin